MLLLVKIKITVYRKHLVFCDSFVWVKVCQILVNFKCRESIWNLKYFIFLKWLFENCLAVKALDSQSRGPGFKTTGWLRGQLSLSFFRDRLNEYYELWTPGDRVAKSKLSPRSGSVALRQLSLIHKKGP